MAGERHLASLSQVVVDSGRVDESAKVDRICRLFVLHEDALVQLFMGHDAVANRIEVFPGKLSIQSF